MTKTTKTKPNQAQGATPATKKNPATKKPSTSRHEVKCCLCGCTIPRPAWDKTDSPYYMGMNNPWPFSADDDGACCCDICNSIYVIPARWCKMTPADARKAQRLVEAMQQGPHVLAARTSSGKSIVAGEALRRAALNGARVLTTRTK